jgi:hypothetical protein
MDDHAARWIAATPLMSLIIRDKSGNVRATLGGDDPGFANVASPNTLTINRSASIAPATRKKATGSPRSSSRRA